MCVCERERERERDRGEQRLELDRALRRTGTLFPAVCVKEKSVCVREGERQRVCVRESVCVCEKARQCVCV